MVAFRFEVGPRDPDGLMGRSASCGELLGQRDFVARGSFVFLEPEGDGAEIAALLRGQGSDGGGIKPGG